jgi:hypothetical protein
VGKIPYAGLLYEHPPEPVGEVNFGEHHHFIGFRAIAEAEDSAENVANLTDRRVWRKACGCVVYSLLEWLRPGVGPGSFRIDREG